MKCIITESQLKRIIEEELEQQEYQELDSYLKQAGIALTPEEKMEIEPDCEVEIPQNEYTEYIEQIKQKLDTMDKAGLINTLKQVTAIKKKYSTAQQPVQEQIAPIVIAGVTVPTAAILFVAGFVSLLIIVAIAKLIVRGARRMFSGGNKVRRRTNSACRRKRRLLKRFGIEGLMR